MITRDEFRKVWSETIRNTDRVLDLIEQGYEGYRFKCGIMIARSTY